MEKNISRKEPHYYSEKLQRELKIIPLAAATVVDAPSGYGKTTAIRDYLEYSLPPSTLVCWFTATDEEPSASFKRLCREVERIDRLAGDRLLKIGLPNASTVGEACDALRCLQCKNEACLVIDNFQFLIDVLPFSFISALLTHGGKGLHLIVITQTLRRDMLAFMQGHGVAHITEAELSFSAGDIRSYYAKSGVAITPKDAAHVEHNTGGWIAAVYLHLRALRERGMLLDTSGILAMMEHLVWDALSDFQQTFLLRLSPFEMVTIQQACALCGFDTLPDEAQEALENPFIRFEPSERRYELHSILSALLHKKRRERGVAFDRECLLRAGNLCRDEGAQVRAMDFYAQARDYGKLFSLDLSAFYFETVGGTPFYELALQIAGNCPPGLMEEHPLSMLRVAYALLTAGMEAEFRTLMERLHPLLDGGEEGAYLLADWTLLSSYLRFPDVLTMTGILKQAATLFRGRQSRVIYPDSPWCYGVCSPFSVFHCAPGEAEREAEALEKYYALYTGLTGGHGSGADVLFRAELMHYRCALDEAEILAYKAVYIAQGRKQHLIQRAGTFHLAGIALKKGDSTGWRNALEFLTQSIPDTLQRSFVLTSAQDTFRAAMLDELGMGDICATDWLKEGDFSARQLPGIKSHSMMTHFTELHRQKKFTQLIGAAEAAYPQGIEVRRFMDAPPALTVAAGYLHLGNRKMAAELISRAIALMLPDGAVLLFIYYDQLLGGLVRECIVKEFPALVSEFDAAVKRYRSCVAIYSELSAGELPQSLTGREREVAMLVIEGLSNNEIAEKLYLTESTVRTHLRAVFKKLDIDRRAKLAKKLL